MPEVRNFLILSTGHVPEHVAKMLDQNDHNAWPICGGPFSTYGWFLYAHEEDCEGTIPPELMAVFKYANEHGCTYVLFDCDGPFEPELPSWEW